MKNNEEVKKNVGKVADNEKDKKKNINKQKESKIVDEKTNSEDGDVPVLTKKTILEHVRDLPVKERYRYYAELGLTEAQIKIIEGLVETFNNENGPEA